MVKRGIFPSFLSLIYRQSWSWKGVLYLSMSLWEENRRTPSKKEIATEIIRIKSFEMKNVLLKFCETNRNCQDFRLLNDQNCDDENEDVEKKEWWNLDLKMNNFFYEKKWECFYWFSRRENRSFNPEMRKCRFLYFSLQRG